MLVWYLEIKSKNFCIVLSSPSGAGKTSISTKLLQKDRKLALSISCTTRPKRKGEINKKDYIFISEEEFKKQIKKNKFLEQASVFGYRYGTLSQTVNNFFKKRRDVLFDIDWQGFQQLKQSGMNVVGIFILPPNKKELIRRLKKRGRDTSEEMKKRMSLAQDEISHFPEYDYVLVNDSLDLCVSKILNIINAERFKKSNQYNLTEFVSKFRD